jgi:thiol-disulfide isomerase/thioredoxin
MKTLKILAFILFLHGHPGISAQEIIVPEMTFSEFEKFLTLKTDTVYIINFWATWCGPCRRELPAFERIHQDYSRESQVL